MVHSSLIPVIISITTILVRNNTNTRLRTIQCHVWSTHIYGAVTWTISKSLLSRLDAFELWIHRRVSKIPLADDINSEEVLRRRGTSREIVRQFKTRKEQYYKTSRITTTIHRMKDRTQKIPQPTKNYWITDLTKSTVTKYCQLKRAAEDRNRNRWHGLIVYLAQETTLRLGKKESHFSVILISSKFL